MGYDPIEDMIALARQRHLPVWDVGEYPHWSIGHGIVTTGVRPRRSPFLHRGSRVNVRRMFLAFVVVVVFPLTILVPISTHATAQIDQVDESTGVAVGTGVFIFRCFAYGYPVAFAVFYGSR